MKCTFCVGTQRNLYSTGLRLGFASAKTQILGFASAKTQIKGFALAPKYQHVGIPNAKFWQRGHCPTPTPDARYFASQLNIGLRHMLQTPGTSEFRKVSQYDDESANNSRLLSFHVLCYHL